jgi:hypothetical protein
VQEVHARYTHLLAEQVAYLTRIGSDANNNHLPDLPAGMASLPAAEVGPGGEGEGGGEKETGTDGERAQEPEADVEGPPGRTGLDMARAGVPLTVLLAAQRELDAREEAEEAENLLDKMG